jgi:hypothetical protein
MQSSPQAGIAPLSISRSWPLSFGQKQDLSGPNLLKSTISIINFSEKEKRKSEKISLFTKYSYPLFPVRKGLQSKRRRLSPHPVAL